MNPARYIRTQVFKVTQVEFAELLSTDERRVSQGLISHYEATKEAFPRWVELRIRKLAREKHLPFSDSWFFEPPNHREAA